MNKPDDYALEHAARRLAEGRQVGHVAERAGIDRRRFLTAGGTALAALAALACDSRGPRSAQRALQFAMDKNAELEGAIFRHTSMDSPRASAALAGSRFPSYFISDTVPVWDDAASGPWALEVGGLVKQPLKLTFADLVKMPAVTERVDHFCVEGWTAVAKRTGVRLSAIAQMAGLSPDVQYVDFMSFDNAYHESWDLASAMHPQTLLVYGQDGRYLPPAWGAPLRVYSPVKLGYKNTKYLTKVMFLPHRTGGYWSDQGYEWFGGT
jgi:DMSO/TMAO reductase YedYZ molybdopterin-dependent catalytic subunit